MIMPDSRLRSRVVDAVIVRRALGRANDVLSLTERETEGLRHVSRYSINLSRIDNGINVPEILSATRPQPPVVLFLARLHPRKHVMVFAEAAKAIVDSGTDACFRVVGPDEGDLSKLLSFIEKNKLSDRLSYSGAVSPGQGVLALQDSTIFVLPSTGEVYPMSVLEALAVGTPVVLSRDCGLAPQLDKARAAVICDPQIWQIASAIRGLLSDESMRVSYSQAGHRYAKQHLSIEAVGDKLESIYARS
jgi:glycosyltransferase involved in cell wall biosynthesis